MLNKRIVIAKRVAQQMGNFGMASAGQKYELLGTFWAAEDFTKGTKAMREGAVDAYDTVMFRMRYTKSVDRWCLIQYLGRWYEIQSFNEDYQTNQLQITATELGNQDVIIVEPPTPTVNPQPQNT